jgi:histidinol-phosphate aminotransferase
VLDLVREDLRGFSGYRSARRDDVDGSVWLNANESPWESEAGIDVARRDAALRRYPEPQPETLRQGLAALYGVRPEQVLAGRGSDEAIDLLVRALCRPGLDAVVVTPPTFGMYAVCARLHGARTIEVPLLDSVQTDSADAFACDFAGVAAAVEREGAKIVFLCSPGNPSGTLLPLDEIEGLAERLRGRALVVVDEAYIEFAQAPSATSLLARLDNIAVLRTLSKAHALAAARIGAVIAAPELIAVLQRCQAPYPLPRPCVEVANAALTRPVLASTTTRTGQVIVERDALHRALADGDGVRRVYSSHANFLLVRFEDAGAAFQALLDAGIVVRDMRAMPGLDDALRISIGTPEQNESVLRILRAVAAQGVQA